MHFEDDAPLEEALEAYYRRNGFSPHAPERFIAVHFGRVTLPFPNTDGRRRVLRLHDLHHVATGYDTDLRGEAEIGAFELGAGCGNSFVVWFYDLGTWVIGLARWPRRTLRGFLRGRRTRTSLFTSPARAQAPTVGALREALGVVADPGPFRVSDAVALVGLVALLLPYALCWPLCAAGLTVAALRAEISVQP